MSDVWICGYRISNEAGTAESFARNSIMTMKGDFEFGGESAKATLESIAEAMEEGHEYEVSLSVEDRSSEVQEELTTTEETDHDGFEQVPYVGDIPTKGEMEVLQRVHRDDNPVNVADIEDDVEMEGSPALYQLYTKGLVARQKMMVDDLGRSVYHYITTEAAKDNFLGQ